MADDEKRRRFEAWLQEYAKLRDEAVQRVTIQNGLVQRGAYLAAGTAGVLVALFKVFTDAGAAGGADTSDASKRFLVAGLIVVFVYGLLIQSLLYNWLYQLFMMFRMIAYRVWVNEHVIPQLVGDGDNLFLWDTASGRNAPWNKPFNIWPFKEGFGQVGPVYGLAILAPVCVLGFSVQVLEESHYVGIAGVVGATFLTITLIVAGFVQKKLHRIVWQVQETGVTDMAEPTGPAGVADSDWDIDKERANVEAILCQRFNFLLLFVSVVVLGAVSAETERLSNIVLTAGAVVCTPLALTIARAQRRLNYMLDEVIYRNPEHIVTKVRDQLAQRKLAVPSMRSWIGYWIPLFCCALLWAGVYCGWRGLLFGP